MTHFLEKTLSSKRVETYKKLSEVDPEGRSFDALYNLNIQYSKELYVMLTGLEVATRNTFNEAISKHMKKADWFELKTLYPKHQHQVNEAIDRITKTKHNNYTVDDLIAHLNFGFWVHLCTRPYEKNLWSKALYKCFPYLGQKPSRADIHSRLASALKLRNKIAHMEPIIKYEQTLIQDYRNIQLLLYAICPQTQKWFEEKCQFEEIWNSRFS